MIDSRQKIMLLGLPESGKTSFLAAFVNYVDSQILDKNLSQYQLSSNSSYISSIVNDWLRAKKPERTKVTITNNPYTEADIFLEDKRSGRKFILHIPDFYGEIFENQFVDRLVEADYIDQLRDCSGVILFIHPEKINDATLIEDVLPARIVEAQINEKFDIIEHSGYSTKRDEDAEPFNLEKSPTQLVLVDLLEAHLEFKTQTMLTLAIVISAWDIVRVYDENLSPLKYIENSLPLLYQFLRSSDQIDFKTFGVSAQGGNIENTYEVERLVALDDPTDRIFVQEEDVPHKNIASPIEWIIEKWRRDTN